jgi:hypothetical protein
MGVVRFVVGAMHPSGYGPKSIVRKFVYYWSRNILKTELSSNPSLNKRLFNLVRN